MQKNLLEVVESNDTYLITDNILCEGWFCELNPLLSYCLVASASANTFLLAL